MDRNTIVRWLLIAGLIIGGYWFFFDRKSKDHGQELPAETYVDAPGFAPDDFARDEKASPPDGETCTIQGNRFVADLSTHGAGLTHLRLTDSQYALSDGADMSTTATVERWRNLRTLFRTAGTPAAPDDQVDYDRFDWKLERLGSAERSTGCKFTYKDDKVQIVKTIAAGARPFELQVDTTLTNVAPLPKRHTASIEIFAYRRNKDVKSKLGRVSPFQTGLECARGKDVKRLSKGADDFKTGWYSEPLLDRYAAITNYYFAQSLVPLEATPGVNGDKPSCDLLDEQWFNEGQSADDDTAGDVYKARLQYPTRTLGPNESATYRQIAFFGPKERDVLAKAAGGWPHLDDLINLGTFSIVAKVLVEIISWIHAHITLDNWGLAIIALTIGLRMVLFPLTWKNIKNMIAMRRLKPEIDALNAKFKDDAQAKNLAMMELWRKNKVNPLGGCLPQLVQMPIWFALYTTLQTAVEFFNVKFLWFSDLSKPDKYFILPLVLGAAMIVQQRVVPQQGMDPMQQKMMTWIMPAVFTVMMLFLPAALGVYMLTNSLLGIAQQLAVEKLFPRVGAPVRDKGDIVVQSDKKDASGDAKTRDKTAAAAAALRKGKARV